MDDQKSAKDHRGLVGFILGVLLTVPALALAIGSGGAGHGDYVFARVLFPSPMLMTVFTGSITLLSMALALIQFPFYGYVFFRAMTSQMWTRVAMIVAAAHVCGVILCFGGVLQGFS